MMGKDAPLWKGKLINRDYVKDMIKAAFKRMAKGKLEEEVGRLTNDLERYMASELILNTREIIKGVRDQLDGSLDFLKSYAEGIDEEIIKRRAQTEEETDGERL